MWGLKLLRGNAKGSSGLIPVVEIFLSTLISASHEELSKLIGIFGVEIELSFFSSFAALTCITFFSSVPLLLGSFCVGRGRGQSKNLE